MSRQRCPERNVGKVFGSMFGATIQGSIIDPDYCIVDDDSKECSRHAVTDAIFVTAELLEHSCDDPYHCHNGLCRLMGSCQHPELRALEKGEPKPSL